MIDRLLAMPQFGERWGRHWLDVARYGESTSKERNIPYPYAWKYRDYVYDSVAADKPFDQFVREQIAGDLLPAKNDAQRNEMLTATGFLTLGPKSLNTRNAEQFRMDMADEQLDVATRGVMGLSVACARCHDHKFDPIPTADYYAMVGIFRSTDVLGGVKPGNNKHGLCRRVCPSDQHADEAQRQRAAEDRKRLAELNTELDNAKEKLQKFAQPQATRRAWPATRPATGKAAKKGKAARRPSSEAAAASKSQQAMQQAQQRIDELTDEIQQLEGKSGARRRAGDGRPRLGHAGGLPDQHPRRGERSGRRSAARLRPRAHLTPNSPDVNAKQSGRLQLADVDDEQEQSAHRPRDGQPRLVSPVRPRHRLDRR